MRSSGLTRRFAAVTLVAVLLIFLVLQAVVQRVVAAQAKQEAVRSAELLTSFVEQDLPADVLSAGLTGDDRQAFDAAARAADTGVGLLSVRLWGPGGMVVYDSEEQVQGRRFKVSGHLQEAYDGRTGADVEKAEDDDGESTSLGLDEVLEVYTPLRVGGGDEVDGALEVYLSYDATAARARDAMRSLALGLGGGLALLWGLMLQLSRRVASKLAQQVDLQEHLARHDALTGLPNRRMLTSGIEEALASGRPVALLLLDLDRFKEVNDTLGHHVGDLLLGEMGPRLSEVCPEGALVARLGGDEFAVLVPQVGHGPETGDEVLLLADRVAQVFEQPFAVGDLLLQVEPSIGVALAPQDAADAATLLQRADVAMYDAKSSHVSAARYRADTDVNTPERLQLLADLRVALAEGRGLRLDYQPLVDVATEAVTGVEALIRWEHPTRGELPPYAFIPLAEQTGLVRPLTRWVLDTALGQCRAWLDQGLRLSVAVNLSARNLAEHDLPTEVSSALVRHRVPAELLILEITESAVIDDPDQAEEVVTRLVELGASISLDDFGTGYSSLATLMRLPLRSLKVDRSFVAGLDVATSSGAVITRTTISMAQQLGLSVVGEGVETLEQLVRLRELGCDTVQGFLLSRPVSPDAVAAFARSRSLS